MTEHPSILAICWSEGRIGIADGTSAPRWIDASIPPTRRYSSVLVRAGAQLWLKYPVQQGTVLQPLPEAWEQGFKPARSFPGLTPDRLWLLDDLAVVVIEADRNQVALDEQRLPLPEGFRAMAVGGGRPRLAIAGAFLGADQSAMPGLVLAEHGLDAARRQIIPPLGGVSSLRRRLSVPSGEWRQLWIFGEDLVLVEPTGRDGLGGAVLRLRLAGRWHTSFVSRGVPRWAWQDRAGALHLVGSFGVHLLVSRDGVVRRTKLQGALATSLRSALYLPPGVRIRVLDVDAVPDPPIYTVWVGAPGQARGLWTAVLQDACVLRAWPITQGEWIGARTRLVAL